MKKFRKEYVEKLACEEIGYEDEQALLREAYIDGFNKCYELVKNEPDSSFN